MIAPKRRISKQRKHKRRSSVWKLDMPGMVKCSHCGEYHLAHRVCSHCGFYNGKEVIKMEEEKKGA
ncbi:MAG: 50S ribosomal protein L32 [Clostridia bacterium]|nr:50S ribosomal protein L32 [Clostridia bacterium]